MSLDNIQLPSIVVSDLFKNSLIDPGMINMPSKSPPTTGFSILGGNGKNIAVLVNVAGSIYLPDEELDFLLGILTACQLTLADVALLNLATNTSCDHISLDSELAPRKVLMFGVAPLELELPLQFPFYQVQQYNNQLYLSAPPLMILQSDKGEKTKLWACLKKIFQIS